MIPAANYPHPSCAETDLVDGLRGLHLHLARRRVDVLGDLRLDAQQDGAPAARRLALVSTGQH